MQQKVDWRHYGVAVVVIGFVLATGFKLLGRGYVRPNAPAPVGAHPRTEDAPTYAPSPEATQPAAGNRPATGGKSS